MRIEKSQVSYLARPDTALPCHGSPLKFMSSPLF